MSMNLKCKEAQLAQTPTWITMVCLFRHNGKKDDWRNVLFRYLKWWDNRFSTLVGSLPEIRHQQSLREQHHKELQRAVKKHGKLHFYME